jgi:hypothetical protein
LYFCTFFFLVFFIFLFSWYSLNAWLQCLFILYKLLSCLISALFLYTFLFLVFFIFPFHYILFFCLMDGKVSTANRCRWLHDAPLSDNLTKLRLSRWGTQLVNRQRCYAAHHSYPSIHTLSPSTTHYSVFWQTHTLVNTQILINTRTHTLAHTHTQARGHTHTHARTHTHTPTHVYTHPTCIHTQTDRQTDRELFESYLSWFLLVFIWTIITTTVTTRPRTANFAWFR